MTDSKSVSEARLARLRLAGLVAALIAAALLLPLGSTLRTPLFDAWQRLNPRDLSDTDVRVVLIDADSLKALGPWPWPRFYLAKLTKEIADRGAAVIGYDAFFVEPDRTGPASFLRLNPSLSPAAQAELQALDSPDSLFSQAIGQAPVVLARAGTAGSDGTSTLSVEADLPARLPADFLRYPRALTAIPELDDVALGHGLANAEPDADGLYRKLPLLLRVSETPVTGFALEVARVALDLDSIALRGGRVVLGKRLVPVTSRGEMRLRFGRFPSTKMISAVDLLQRGGQADLKGKAVVIGTAAEGTVDVAATPLEPKLWGVLVQAQAVDALLRGAGWLERPRWALAAEWGAALALAVLALWLLPRRGRAQWLVAGAGAALFFGAWVVFEVGGLLLDPLPALTLATASAIAIGLASLQQTRREREQLRETLVEERVVTAANEAELDAARSIQQAMLPRPEALATLDPRIEVAAMLEPAKSVGGDFFDATRLPDGTIAFAIADVTGKGVPAALFMALSKTLAKSAVLRASLERIAPDLQAGLSRDAPEEMGLTMLIGTLDPGSGAVRLVNAGHENPLIRHANGSLEDVPMEGGPPFCITDYPWPVEPLTLGPGDTLVLMTDGVTEAQDATGALFGRERLLAALREAPPEPQALIGHVLSAVRRFEGNAPASDDLTLMALRRVA